VGYRHSRRFRLFFKKQTTMILIAHRGLIDGPNRDYENHPDQIYKALDAGFDAEIDLWLYNNKLMLGHDQPQYEIERSFLEHNGLWIHAKNLEVLAWLTTTDLNYFWHQEDDYVITSHHFIWTYPGKTLTARSISVMPEWHDSTLVNIPNYCLGICSDYVGKIRKIQ